ncbi:CsxC family protein [Bacillus sp. ISL-37]|jgi:hypothetical protein|uniref:CsxC family protein n=1 Tax=Bacillus sp. ISL-37 TaxID=2819123 RepID=UPI001BE61774|nr:DUF3794 domain-containing protein [Bacillus sp. ISL-37]MBT2686101.1 DUF3794 domain-containing protein [Bacillus sp. ISL-37]
MTNDHKGKRGCVNVNKSASRNECVNVPTPDLIPVANLPVTLADITVTDHLVADIHFPDPVLEIKDIKKRVKIVQCRLLLGPTSDPVTGIPLFIKGFIRKNIQYATPCPHAKSDCVSSEMRSLTVDVPFECVTIITDFLTDPVLPVSNTREEFDFFRAQSLGHGYPEKDQMLSSDLSQFHQVSTQFYNQIPFCELVSSSIVQWDEATDRYPLPNNGPFEEGTFHNMVEKTFLQFRVRVYQNQQVAINGNGDDNGNG